MISNLSINLEKILHQCQVEGERLEYKVSWNTYAFFRPLHALCNDFDNLNTTK
jgi:hypothetical protein